VFPCSCLRLRPEHVTPQRTTAPLAANAISILGARTARGGRAGGCRVFGQGPPRQLRSRLGEERRAARRCGRDNGRYGDAVGGSKKLDAGKGDKRRFGDGRRRSHRARCATNAAERLRAMQMHRRGSAMPRRPLGCDLCRRTEIAEARDGRHARIRRQRRSKVQHGGDNQNDEAKGAPHRRYSSPSSAGSVNQRSSVRLLLGPIR